MNDLEDLLKTFEPSSRGREKFKEFCAHCYCTFEKKIKSTKSKKNINKYNIMRRNTLEYIAANEKAIMFEINKRK